MLSSKGLSVVEMVEVDNKMLALWYEVGELRGTRKWLTERDWRDIETIMEEFIMDGKYLRHHEETFQASGNIMLKITSEPCSTPLQTLFGASCSDFHKYHLKIDVTYLVLNRKRPCCHAADKYESENRVILDDEEGYIPEATGSSTVTSAVSYTPSKKSKKVEEYVPHGIPENATQYKAKRRKKEEELESSPDILGISPPEAGPSTIPATITPPTRKSPRRKRDLCIIDDTQVPPPEATNRVSPRRKPRIPTTMTIPKAKPKSSQELFGSGSDSEAEMKNFVKSDDDDWDKKKSKKKKQTTLANWVSKENVQSVSRRQDLRILSPTREIKKKPKKSKKKEKASAYKMPKLPEASPGRKNCFHIPVDDFIKMYSLVEDEMNPIVEKYKSSGGFYAPKVRGYQFTLYVYIIQTEQIHALTNFLGDKYRNRDDPNEDYSSLINWLVMFVLPEWCLRVFMQEHNMTRSEVIDYFNEADYKDGLAWNLDSSIL